MRTSPPNAIAPPASSDGTDQTAANPPATGRFSAHGVDMSVTFTPRPMKDLLEFGGVNLPQYPPLRNSCITGERLRHAPLRKLDDGLPAAPRGKPKIKLRADMSIEELRAEMERKVQEDPSCRPKQ